MKRFWIAAALAVAGVRAVPAAATLTTFGQYTQVNSGPDVTFDSATNRLASNANNLVYFTVLGASSPVEAVFSLSAVSQTGSTFNVPNGPKGMTDFNGVFSFALSQAATINGVNYSAGSVLLRGNFTNATLSGSGSTGSLVDSDPNGDPSYVSTVDYSSPSGLLDFGGGQSRDFALAFSQAIPGFTVSGNKLQGFSAASTGTFSSDPAPSVASASVPELSTWAMMMLGFGAIGAVLRRPRSTIANL